MEWMMLIAHLISQILYDMPKGQCKCHHQVIKNVILSQIITQFCRCTLKNGIQFVDHKSRKQ